MTGAIALAIVLVVAVIGVSMAMETQRSQTPLGRPTRASSPGQPRRQRERPKDRKAQEPEVPASDPDAAPPPADFGIKGPDLLRSGRASDAKVLSVVDERTIGPVTRSRLSLQITPDEGGPFEVTVRMAFPTPEARAQVKVGSTVPVRYDVDDRTRVVVDLPQS